MKRLYYIIVVGVLLISAATVSGENTVANNSQYLVKAVVDNGLVDPNEGVAIQVYIENYSDTTIKYVHFDSHYVQEIDQATKKENNYVGSYTMLQGNNYLVGEAKDINPHSTEILKLIVMKPEELISNAIYKISINVDQYTLATKTGLLKKLKNLGKCTVEFRTK